MSSFTLETTADDVANALGSQIQGKNILLTGVNPQSIAFAAARALAAKNPNLIVFLSRDPTVLKESKDALLKDAPNVNARVVVCDLASQESIRKAAAEINAFDEKLDVVINSAGVMANPLSRTSEGIESQLGVNHIGHFLLTNLIVGKLNKGARIINVSSKGYQVAPIAWDDINFEKAPYNKWQAYAQSKAANILFSSALARKLASKGIISYSLHPGTVPGTRLGRHMTQEDFEMLKNIPLVFKTADQAAATLLVAAFDPTIKEHNGGHLDDDNQIKPIPDAFSYAVGSENEDKLWLISESLVGEKFSY